MEHEDEVCRHSDQRPLSTWHCGLWQLRMQRPPTGVAQSQPVLIRAPHCLPLGMGLPVFRNSVRKSVEVPDQSNLEASEQAECGVRGAYVGQLEVWPCAATA